MEKRYTEAVYFLYIATRGLRALLYNGARKESDKREGMDTRRVLLLLCEVVTHLSFLVTPSWAGRFFVQAAVSMRSIKGKAGARGLKTVRVFGRERSFHRLPCTGFTYSSYAPTRSYVAI